MNFNNKIIDIYLNNMTKYGNRISTWVWLAEKHKVSKITLSRVSTIRKYCDDQAFQTFLECMRSDDTVKLSNGTSSHNIDHIATLLREGNTVVGKGRIATTTNTRVDVSSVYLLHSNGHYKIGVTLDTSINRRIKQLQIGNPYIINLLGKTGTIPNAYTLEKQLHKKFKDNKVRGEWFTLNDSELEYVLKTINKASQLDR
jgi:hypothetical protein